MNKASGKLTFGKQTLCISYTALSDKKPRVISKWEKLLQISGDTSALFPFQLEKPSDLAGSNITWGETRRDIVLGQ